MRDRVETPGDKVLDEIKLRDRLREMREGIPDDPWINPIQKMAFDLSRDLEGGKFTVDDLRRLTLRLLDRACVSRARWLASRTNVKDQETTRSTFADYVRSTTRATEGDGDAERESAKDFEAFKNRWSRARGGIVLTGHPTFSLSRELSRRMIELAVSPSDAENAPIMIPHRPNDPIDLKYEHERTQATIKYLRDAIQELAETFAKAAADEYGDQAYLFRPKLLTIASWVGYDLDGRTDITWKQTFTLKLKEKHAALEDIRERFLRVRSAIKDDSPDIQQKTRQIVGKLDLAIAAVADQVSAFEHVDDDAAGLTKAANVLTKEEGYNLTSVDPLLGLLQELVELIEDDASRARVAGLATLIDTTGLGTAHIHLRINAAQLENAIRAYVQEPWATNLDERQSLLRLSKMIEEAKPETVNFGTLEQETATAIRQLALAAQIKKHVDRDTEIRYLIAECESPAIVLIAVFFAKLFDVDDIVDVSPLLETATGLERGARIIERLLEEEPYRDYVRKRRRLALQTGFSDAGRFFGQIAATLAVERMHLDLARTLKNVGLDNEVETLIFSTHGESMGRGAHPGTLHDRLQYVLPPAVRYAFSSRGRPLKHETSFQGSDGFMMFGNLELTTAAVAQIIADGEMPTAVDDPFYDDENLTRDFHLRLKEYQEDLFAHPGYRALLGAYGSNLLFKTGSRAVKRQSDVGLAADRGDPSRMRAIPNNALLQQFGYTANVVAGIGVAAGHDRDKIIELGQKSDRLRMLLGMVARAKQQSSLNAMGANANVFDAGFWASRASWGKEPELEPAFRALSEKLLGDERVPDISELMHHLRLDAIHLHQILEQLGLEDGKIPDDQRLELDLLQAIRSAMIMRIFILSAKLPRFATRNDMSYDQLLSMALALDVPEVLDFMRQAFPHQGIGTHNGETFREEATYQPAGITDYARLESEFLTPMEQAFDFVREVGTGISHHFGAIG